MGRHAVLTTVAVAVLSLSVLSSPVLAQDEQQPPRASEDLLARVEALRAKLLADIRASAEAGDALSQYSLGRRYADGDGVPQDAAEAVTWYRLAAAQGLATAQLSLGLMYATGQGVPQDDAEVVAWYRLAAEQGRATAQYFLGVMYAEGRGVPQDDAEAETWYRLAAQQGHAPEKDELAAAHLADLRASAEGGEAVAQTILGYMYAFGSLRDSDAAGAEAVAWLHKAAEQGRRRRADWPRGNVRPWPRRPTG